MTQHTLFVCESCRFSVAEKERDGLRGGMHLLNHLQNHLQANPISISLSVQPVKCAAACGRPCVIGLVAPGKLSYVFGDQSPTDAESIVRFVCQYVAQADGRVLYRDRPEALQQGVISVLPATSQTQNRWDLSCDRGVNSH
jgi:predicted metal-binding protein